MNVVKIFCTLGWMHVMVHAKNCHKVVVFSTYLDLMDHGGYLVKILWWKFVINGGLHPNLPLCYEIGAQMRNSIMNLNTFLFCN
jgi:hypothetical protein